MNPTPADAENTDYQRIQRIYLDWHDGHRPLSGFVNEIEALIDAARTDEVKKMPHQYDPDLKMHKMSDDEIPQPTECTCYKGRRLAQLSHPAPVHKSDKE